MMLQTKNLTTALIVVSLTIVGGGLVSCWQKAKAIEPQNNTKASFARQNCATTKQDVEQLLAGKWRFKGHEIEYYDGNSAISKKNESWIEEGFYTNLKPGGTYQNFDLAGTTNGTYELLSASYYVQDKGTEVERYYYIINLSDGTLITRGPFNKDNSLMSNFLFTGYYQRW